MELHRNIPPIPNTLETPNHQEYLAASAIFNAITNDEARTDLMNAAKQLKTNVQALLYNIYTYGFDSVADIKTLAKYQSAFQKTQQNYIATLQRIQNNATSEQVVPFLVVVAEQITDPQAKSVVNEVIDAASNPDKMLNKDQTLQALKYIQTRLQHIYNTEQAQKVRSVAARLTGTNRGEIIGGVQDALTMFSKLATGSESIADAFSSRNLMKVGSGAAAAGVLMTATSLPSYATTTFTGAQISSAQQSAQAEKYLGGSTFMPNNISEPETIEATTPDGDIAKSSASNPKVEKAQSGAIEQVVKASIPTMKEVSTPDYIKKLLQEAQKAQNGKVTLSFENGGKRYNLLLDTSHLQRLSRATPHALSQNIQNMADAAQKRAEKVAQQLNANAGRDAVLKAVQERTNGGQERKVESGKETSLLFSDLKQGDKITGVAEVPFELKADTVTVYETSMISEILSPETISSTQTSILKTTNTVEFITKDGSKKVGQIVVLAVGNEVYEPGTKDIKDAISVSAEAKIRFAIQLPNGKLLQLNQVGVGSLGTINFKSITPEKGVSSEAIVVTPALINGASAAKALPQYFKEYYSVSNSGGVEIAANSNLDRFDTAFNRLKNTQIGSFSFGEVVDRVITVGGNNLATQLFIDELHNGLKRNDPDVVSFAQALVSLNHKARLDLRRSTNPTDKVIVDLLGLLSDNLGNVTISPNSLAQARTVATVDIAKETTTLIDGLKAKIASANRGSSEDLRVQNARLPQVKDLVSNQTFMVGQREVAKSLAEIQFPYDVLVALSARYEQNITLPEIMVSNQSKFGITLPTFPQIAGFLLSGTLPVNIGDNKSLSVKTGSQQANAFDAYVSDTGASVQKQASGFSTMPISNILLPLLPIQLNSLTQNITLRFTAGSSNESESSVSPLSILQSDIDNGSKVLAVLSEYTPEQISSITASENAIVAKLRADHSEALQNLSDAQIHEGLKMIGVQADFVVNGRAPHPQFIPGFAKLSIGQKAAIHTLGLSVAGEEFTPLQKSAIQSVVGSQLHMRRVGDDALANQFKETISTSHKDLLLAATSARTEEARKAALAKLQAKLPSGVQIKIIPLHQLKGVTVVKTDNGNVVFGSNYYAGQGQVTGAFSADQDVVVLEKDGVQTPVVRTHASFINNNGKLDVKSGGCGELDINVVEAYAFSGKAQILKPTCTVFCPASVKPESVIPNVNFTVQNTRAVAGVVQAQSPLGVKTLDTIKQAQEELRMQTIIPLHQYAVLKQKLSRGGLNQFEFERLNRVIKSLENQQSTGGLTVGQLAQSVLEKNPTFLERLANSQITTVSNNLDVLVSQSSQFSVGFPFTGSVGLGAESKTTRSFSASQIDSLTTALASCVDDVQTVGGAVQFEQTSESSFGLSASIKNKPKPKKPEPEPQEEVTEGSDTLNNSRPTDTTTVKPGNAPTAPDSAQAGQGVTTTAPTDQAPTVNGTTPQAPSAGEAANQINAPVATPETTAIPTAPGTPAIPSNPAGSAGLGVQAPANTAPGVGSNLGSPTATPSTGSTFNPNQPNVGQALGGGPGTITPPASVPPTPVVQPPASIPNQVTPPPATTVPAITTPSTPPVTSVGNMANQAAEAVEIGGNTGLTTPTINPK